MQFNAELKKSSQRKSLSNDNTYQLVFETSNPMVLDLGKLPSNTLFSLEIGIDGTRDNKNTDDLLPE
jgi:hypothetical protein